VISKYTNLEALKDAIKVFDYDNDGKIQFEEFEYFMKNFGESENFYMDENKI
jgi:Ca2+-binding EF-hand superfamily protein